MENAITILQNLIYHRFFHISNTTGVTSGAGTAFPSEAPDLTTGFDCPRTLRTALVQSGPNVTSNVIMLVTVTTYMKTLPNQFNCK
jgi:hypothetical protein